MDKENFKVELFSKLYETSKIGRTRVFSIGKDLLSEALVDLRFFMDSELQMLVMQKPYSVKYLKCESDADKLTFLDINPDIVENNEEVAITNYDYDCEKQQVVKLVTTLKIRKN